MTILLPCCCCCCCSSSFVTNFTLTSNINYSVNFLAKPIFFCLSKQINDYPPPLLLLFCHKFYIDFKHQLLTQFFGQADFSTLHAKSFQNILGSSLTFLEVLQKWILKMSFLMFFEKSHSSHSDFLYMI